MPNKPTGKPRRAAKKPEPAPESQPSTKIDLQGSDNAVAVGPRSFAANVKVIFQGNWKPFAAVLFGVGVLLAVILWFVVPRQADEFSGQFNVAVAEFLVQDEDGNIIRSEDGRKLAESIQSQIQANFTDMRLDTVTTYEIWGPERSGVIQDEEEARGFADSTGATIVIYGRIKQANGISFFSPRFYVNHTAFKEAEEITGQHELGKDIQGRSGASIPLVEISGVQARVDGMSMLTIGMVYYSVERYPEALSYFQKADEPEWVGSGKETVYLLTGNTYVRQASETGDFSSLPLAEQYYKAALEINADYGRAMIGEANVLYQRAITQKDCDASDLEAASQLLDEASNLTDQPPSANIETKVHYYRGQIALIREDCQIPGGDWRAIAEQEFNWVVARYEADPESDASQSITSLASEAYARLSYIAYYFHSDANAAIAWLQKAIPLASLYKKGFYTASLGDMYVVIGETDRAIESYQQAIAIAIGAGDAESAENYQKKLDLVTVP